MVDFTLLPSSTLQKGRLPLEDIRVGDGFYRTESRDHDSVVRESLVMPGFSAEFLVEGAAP